MGRKELVILRQIKRSYQNKEKGRERKRKGVHRHWDRKLRCLT